METETKNLYSILGVEPSADKNKIKSAYRQLAKKYHPDTNKGNKSSEKIFKEITQAYEILSDETKRKEYDKLYGYNQPPKQSNPYSNPRKAEQNYKKQSSPPKKQTKNNTKTKQEEQNIKENFSKFVNEIFSQTTRKQIPINGTNIFVDLTVSIFEAQNGTTRRINILHSDCCPYCKGKKFLNGTKCQKCSGTGEISTQKSITVNIPAGTLNGSIITLSGEGNRGEFGGENGNLFLKIIVEKNDAFKFSGLNVLSDIPISPTEAALGTTIKINTIDGTLSVKIPPETSSGQKFRLHGQGIFDKETGQKGDHIVTVYIKIPKNLSQQEKELYNKLAMIRNFNPRNEF